MSSLRQAVTGGRRAAWVGIGGVVLLGLFLRLYRLDYQSVWYDEALSLTFSRLPLGEMTERLIIDFAHPPLHTFFLHVWFALLGFGTLQARLLSALFGSLAVLMVYVLARYLFERRTALLASLLLAVSQLAIMYSQEARSYAQLLFFVLTSTYLFVVALWERPVVWWGFLLSAVIMVHTHYYGGFVVAAFALYLLFRKPLARPRASWLAGAAIALLLCIPWMSSGVVGVALHNRRAVLRELPSWFTVHWWTFFTTMNDFQNGRLAGFHASFPRWTFVVGAVLFAMPALLAVGTAFAGRADYLSERAREGTRLLAILWLLPLLLAIGLGAFHFQYDRRYVVFCIAPFYILVARGISTLESPVLRRVLVAAVLAYSSYALRANYFIPYKENYRDALAYLAHAYHDGDCCIFLPFNDVPMQWQIYDGNRPALNVTSVDAVTSGKARCERVWLITYRRVDWAVERDQQGERALELTHSKVSEARYFWVDVERYDPKQT